MTLGSLRKTCIKDYWDGRGALDAIIAAIDLEDSFQNLEDKTISEWKIDGVNIEFNIKCDNDTG